MPVRNEMLQALRSLPSHDFLADGLQAGSIIEAGSDTTRNQLNLMLAAAAKYPDWVAKAQEQLDEVCGKASRLPAFDVGRLLCVDCSLELTLTGLGSIAIYCSGDQRNA